MLKKFLKKKELNNPKDETLTSKVKDVDYMFSGVMPRNLFKYELGETVYAKFLNLETNTMDDIIGKVIQATAEFDYYVIEELNPQGEKGFASVPHENIKIAGMA